MNITVILGSTRKKNSYGVIQELISQIRISHDINYIFLNDYHLEYCKGCGYCKIHKTCYIQDDSVKIKKSLLSSDLIILASPVYMNRESALMKNFLDRFHYFHFFPQFFNKRGLTIVTGTTYGFKDVVHFLEFNLQGWGCNLLKSQHRNMLKYRFTKKYQLKNKLLLFQLSQKINKIHEKNKYYIPLRFLLSYQIQKNIIMSMKSLYKEPYEFWIKNNFFDNYYYNKRINFFYKIIIKIYILFKKLMIFN